MQDLLARLTAATDGNDALDRALCAAFGLAYRDTCPAVTTVFADAYALLPNSVTNFDLFNFGSRDAGGSPYWGCRVHDMAQLVGTKRAYVRTLKLPIRIGEETRLVLEKAIAERFCEFSSTHMATACLAICSVALKVRLGQTQDDDDDDLRKGLNP